MSTLMPDKDARTYALQRLRDFVCAVEFRRTGSTNGAPIAFKLSPDRFDIEQPDDVREATMPSIAVIPGRGFHPTNGLGPAELDEDSFNVYSKGKALLKLGFYEETFQLEVRGSKKAERRALMAALKKLFRLSQDSSSIRLSLPAYFDRVATFSLDESQYIDGDEVVRNRRRGFIQLRLSVEEVDLVDVVRFRPSARVDVLDGKLGLELHSVTDAQLGLVKE